VRIAIVSDIHGNRTALEAVIADLKHASPDLVLHGGDLADGGANPAWVVDRIRELGWQGVLGNTDEMLFQPKSLSDFAAKHTRFELLFAAIEETAAWTRRALGPERLKWLATLPRVHIEDTFALVHAGPESTWVAPSHEAPDAELETVYAPLGRPIAIYAHIHRPFVRRTANLAIANTGSVSLSYDGDPHAAYLLVEDGGPVIRRVGYDVEAEAKAIAESGLPHGEWIAKTLRCASFQMP
jgi:predicted phosphodiesterase